MGIRKNSSPLLFDVVILPTGLSTASRRIISHQCILSTRSPSLIRLPSVLSAYFRHHWFSTASLFRPTSGNSNSKHTKERDFSSRTVSIGVDRTNSTRLATSIFVSLSGRRTSNVNSRYVIDTYRISQTCTFPGKRSSYA
jgi:hypothetical protein